ncbi:response regulator [Gloeothece verrucosa]|uniref:Response regulator receiver protein n=1 Tax=Gloeothece verrucosa (strain PCC 7822) TaxID=497965 RepID=E0ULU2_GLOV7|nr:response regulator [Gloeothece verrucosa]ADN17922.1 response regulator receiver protein [Gloeothece verrucosa PCC 7822]
MIHFLLVEDDEVDVLKVKRAFRNNHITHPLYIAKNGKEALFWLRSKNGKPPIVPQHGLLTLLDLNMPEMTGIEFLQELRSDVNLKKIPVIVLTVSESEQDLLKAYNLNVAGYILKSMTFESFSQAIITINNYWSLNLLL